MAKRFTGKIRTDPWESLSRGRREVMAAIWQEYLEDLLEGSLTSARNKLLRQDIEKAAGLPEIYHGWNELTPEERADAWRRLVTAARTQVEASRETCLRCGDCCLRSSPTLLLPDLQLLADETITWNDLYTLRPGDVGTSRTGSPVVLEEERLKIREVPGSQQCTFFLAATRSCRIYENRPEQCRRQQCWGEPPPPPQPADFLHREHLFAQVPEIRDLIRAHEERCNLAALRKSLKELAAGRHEASEELFEALHFDHYLRKMFQEEWGLTEAATELILGRPVTRFLKDLGFHATLTPEGVFQITARGT
uniref:YkgJ family cysteine cluster protein n=1 Tax=Desulfobacca acetoxidans TaxID=60893 RepID=A0A7V6A5Z3_9BACT